MLEKSIKQLNRVSISFCLVLGLGLVLEVVLGLVLGLVPSSDIVLKSTVLLSSCVPSHGYMLNKTKTILKRFIMVSVFCFCFISHVTTL